MTVAVDLVGPLARARGAGFGLPVRALPVPEDERGWRPATAVAADERLREELLDRIAAGAGTGSRAVAVTWQLEKHAWFVAAAALAAVLVHGRAPRLDDVLLRDGAYGWVEEVALPATGWRAAGAARLASELEAQLAPLVEVLGRHRPRRALWRSAGDRVGQAALWCGEAFGDRHAAWSLAAEVLDQPTAMRAPGRFELRDGEPFRLRTGCCLSHRCAGGATCADCPVGDRRAGGPAG